MHAHHLHPESHYRRSLQQTDALSNSDGCLASIPKCEPGTCATRNVLGVARWVCLRCLANYEAVVTTDGQDNIVQCGESSVLGLGGVLRVLCSGPQQPMVPALLTLVNGQGLLTEEALRPITHQQCAPVASTRHPATPPAARAARQTLTARAATRRRALCRAAATCSAVAASSHAPLALAARSTAWHPLATP
jgi:hypothetical protein